MRVAGRLDACPTTNGQSRDIIAAKPWAFLDLLGGWDVWKDVSGREQEPYDEYTPEIGFLE